MFQGLSTALTALYAQRGALETTGNNIANVNTEGYTRQRVDMESIGGSTIPSFWNQSSKVGMGVTIKDVARLRDQFLETRGLQEHGTQGRLDRMTDTMQTIELSFGEPGENGIQRQLSEFWAAWDDVVNNPSEAAARSQVVEQAHTLTSVFQQSSRNLTQLADNSLDELKRNVTQLNGMAQNVADLNKAITRAINSGASANSLLDQRDLLVEKMSTLAGVTVQPTESGSIAVLVGGFAITRDDRVTNLEVDDSGTPVQLKWDADNNTATTTNGTKADVRGGDLSGLLEAITITVPKYRAQLDAVATSLITKVNTQHATGTDKNGNPGGPFFAGTSALTLEVDPALAADDSLIAAGAAGGGPLDIENARAMATFAESVLGPDADYRKLIDLLGVEAQRTFRQVDIQTSITNAVDVARQSTSGVNLDEEMANLVRFEKSYSAAAKYMSVMDQMLDTLLSMVR